MTLDEAKKVGDIISTADGGCDTCVDSLCDLLNKAKLGFEFKMTGKRIENISEVIVFPAKTY